jgi:predicted SprT family Zn-dependent metalloprotease
MMLDKILATQTLAERLIKEYGLDDWKFVYDQTKNRIGQCRYSSKEIGYSVHFIKETPMDEIEDTIRHEIAHALVGPGNGHNQTWKLKAMIVGANPRSCSEIAQVSAKPNFIVECSKCGKEWERFRLRKSLLSESARSSCCKAPLNCYDVREEATR